jgi:hypothetical protein
VRRLENTRLHGEGEEARVVAQQLYRTVGAEAVIQRIDEVQRRMATRELEGRT